MPPRLVSPIPREALAPIEEYLRAHNLGKNLYRKKVGEGVSQCLGIVGKRCLKPDLSRQSWLHPRLHHLLEQFAKEHVPIPYTSIQVNVDFSCAAHKDVNNTGESFIVGFGDYRGGALCIEDFDYDIRYRGLLFDGSQLTHWTKEWMGNRFTLVFHSLKPQKRFGFIVPLLSEYEAVQDGGEWKILRKSDGVFLTKKNGLAHPLKKKVD